MLPGIGAAPWLVVSQLFVLNRIVEGLHQNDQENKASMRPS
jgi:hypothetical protein